MESENEYWDDFINNETSNSNQRNSWIIISWINGKTFLHTDIIKPGSISKDEGTASYIYIKLESGPSLFIDVNKQTSKLSPIEIDTLALRSIFTNELENYEHDVKMQDHVMEEEKKLIKHPEESTNDYGLSEREKHQKLTIQQKRLIKMEIESSELTSSHISIKYGVSPSLVSKIKNSRKHKFDENFNKGVTKIYGKNKEEIISEMAKYSNESTYAFTVNDMTKHINSKFNSNYSTHFIRKHMRNGATLRYKKAKSRPWNIDFAKVGWSRRYFALKFAQITNKETLMINIDESCINRSLKTDRSWIAKGQSKEIKSIKFYGSLSIVMAIWNNGTILALLSNETIDSKKFWLFLENLNSWLNKNKNFGFSETLLLLDNWSIHKSKITKEVLWRINTNVLYLPAYSPDFAPIEMWFSILKRNINFTWSNQYIKLNSKQWYSKVVDALKKIEPKTIKRLFKRLFSEIQRYIAINNFA